MRASRAKLTTRICALGAALTAPLGCSLLIDGDLEGLARAPTEEAGAQAPGISSNGPPDSDAPAPQGGATSSGGEGGATSSDGEGGATSSGGEGGATSSGGEGGATSAGGEGGATSAGGERGATSAIWERLPGRARDIAHGADGSAWIIETDSVSYGDLGISKWTGLTWESANGGGIRIAVGPKGVPWTVNTAHEIYRHSDNPYVGVWDYVTGSATDIALGADGSVWIVAANDLGNGDFGICKWNGNGCDATEGGAVHIAVTPDGVPWIVNTVGEIYRRTSKNPWEGHWEAVPGQARDIAAGADGSVWIIRNERIGFEDFRIAVWDAQLGAAPWLSVDGAAVAISVDPTGAPWIVNAAGLIHRFRGELSRTP